MGRCRFVQNPEEAGGGVLGRCRFVQNRLLKGIPCQIDAESFPYAPRALFDMEFYVKPFDMEPMSILTWSSMTKLYVRGGINLTWYPMSKLIYTKTR